MGATWLTPVEITPSSIGWVDVDVSSYVPSGATGVIFHIENTNTTYSYATGWRKNGSTDTLTISLQIKRHFWAACGVDANRILEIYVGNTTYINVYLVGYFDSSAVFLTNVTNLSLSSTGSWQDIDINVNDGAIGAILKIIGTTTSYDFGIRKNGSSDNRTNLFACGSFGFIGVDENEIFEGYISNANVDFYLQGYIKSDATFNTNATDLSLSSTGSYYDLTALPEGATGGFVEVTNVSGANLYALRKNGSTEDIYQYCVRHYWAAVECDENRIIEGKINSAEVDFFLSGYTTVSVPSTYDAINIRSSSSWLNPTGVKYWNSSSFTEAAAVKRWNGVSWDTL